MSLLPACPTISATERGLLRNFAFRFLTRDGCHLCDAAHPLVMAEATRLGIPLLEVDVEDDDELLANYGLRIPVVLGPDGQVIAEGAIEDRRALRRSFRRALSR